MVTQVPSLDLKLECAGLRKEILAALDRVCQNASFILVEEVVQFEKQFVVCGGTKYCVALSRGTGALHLALSAAGVQARRCLYEQVEYTAGTLAEIVGRN